MTGAARRVAVTPIGWMKAEPARLERDSAEIAAFAPDVEFVSPSANAHQGYWIGVLPIWPFDRPAPDGLDDLTFVGGLKFALYYKAAYPMVPPVVYALEPEPTLVERTQNRWHVAPGGSLCLLQSDGAWTPEASIVELLLKAAGWRIEYALMKAGLIESMSTNGIVSDGSRDELIARATQLNKPQHLNEDGEQGQ